MVGSFAALNPFLERQICLPFLHQLEFAAAKMVGSFAALNPF